MKVNHNLCCWKRSELLILQSLPGLLNLLHFPKDDFSVLDHQLVVAQIPPWCLHQCPCLFPVCMASALADDLDSTVHKFHPSKISPLFGDTIFYEIDDCGIRHSWDCGWRHCVCCSLRTGELLKLCDNTGDCIYECLLMDTHNHLMRSELAHAPSQDLIAQF
jgi:hypothetical protein